MSVIGYIRVSSNKQTVEHQRFEIQNFAHREGLKIDVWEEETISSRRPLSKRKISEVMQMAKDKDIIIACEISRFGRSISEVLHILEVFLNKGCQVWTIKENYKLGNNMQSKIVACIFGLAAEIERTLISERTKSSLANIRASGKKLGRPIKSENKKLKLSKNQEKIKLLLDEGFSKSKIAKMMGVQRSTLNRFIKRVLQSPIPV